MTENEPIPTKEEILAKISALITPERKAELAAMPDGRLDKEKGTKHTLLHIPANIGRYLTRNDLGNLGAIAGRGRRTAGDFLVYRLFEACRKLEREREREREQNHLKVKSY